MAQYGKPTYWEERYLKDPDPFDWYQRYNNNPHLRGLLEKAVPRTAAILVPGSGTSRLSEDMLADGYTGGITNIDISRTAIDLMADRCKDRAGLQFQVMNSCSLGFPDASFDAVIDKAMLDSLLCGEASTANTGRYVGEVARVLKPGGTFIIVSFGAPENRLSYLEGDYGWQVTVHSIPKPTVNTAGLPEVNSSDPSQQHYVYTAKKQA